MKELIDYIKDNESPKINSLSEMSFFHYGIEYLFEIFKRLKMSKAKKTTLCNGCFISPYKEMDDNEDLSFNTFILSLDNGYFYNRYILSFNVEDIYSELREIILDSERIRKENKVKPKNKKFEYMIVDIEKGIDVIVFLYLDNTYVTKYSIKMYESNDDDIDNISKSMNKINRLFGDILEYKHLTSIELFNDISESSPQIKEYAYIIGNKEILVPMAKSFTFSITKPDHVFLSLFDIDISNYHHWNNKKKYGQVYGYNITYCKNKIIEIHSSYILG